MVSHDWFKRLLPAALVTCAVALYNEFPLTFPDTGTYLSNAHDLLRGRAPAFFDRPFTYGVFLMPFASAYTLWLVPLAHGFIVAWVVDLTLRSAGVPLSNRQFFALFAALTAFTSLPWVSGRVLPDIFTGLVILLSFVVFWGEERVSRMERIGASALLIFAIATHLSHIALYAVLLVVGFLGWAVAKGAPALWSRMGPLTLRAAAPLVLAVGIVLAPNYLLHGEAVVSRSSDLFVLARLVNDGLAQRYLDRACTTQRYLLCSEAERLPRNGTWFLWSSDGPRRRYEGDSTFLREADAIVSGTIRQEWPAVIRLSLVHTADQLTQIGTHPWEHRFSSTVEGPMRRMGLLESYRASRQLNGTIPANAATSVQYIAVALSLVVLLACLPLLRERKHRPLRWLIVTVFVGLAVNAFVVSNLSATRPRYQSRVVWLVPLIGVVAAVETVRERHRQPGGPDPAAG